MVNANSKLYEDPEYCKTEVLRARDLFSDRRTTSKQYDAMECALSFIYLYCTCGTVRNLAYSALSEAGMRKPFFEILWANA